MRLGSRKKSRGAAVVELAICLPLLIALVWGTIELNGSIFLKQTLTSAAHDGVLVGLRLNATESEIVDRVNLVLSARGIDDGVVAIETETNQPFESLVEGEAFTVVVSLAHSSEMGLFSLSEIESAVTALKQ